MKLLLKILAVLACLFLFLAGISYVLVTNYVKSPDFAQDVSDLASEKLDGELEMEGLEVEGMGVQAEKIVLNNAGSIRSLAIDGFETAFGNWAILEQRWTMKNLECDRLTVEIGKAPKKEGSEKEKPSNQQQVALKELPKKGGAEKKPTFYQRFIPNKLEFGSLRVGQFSGRVKGKKEDVVWENVALQGDFQKETLELNLSGGSLQIPSEVLSQWQIINADVVADMTSYQLKNGRFSLGDGATAEIEGRGDYDGEALQVAVGLRSVPLYQVLEKQASFATIAGLVNGDLEASSTNGGTVTTQGQVWLEGGTVKLPSMVAPVLKAIELDGGSTLQLDTFSSDVTNTGKRTLLENLNVVVGNTYKVRGKAELNGKSCVVNCQLGVSSAVHGRLPAKLQAKYTQEGEFFWIPVNHQGMTDNLGKDLGRKAATSFGASMLGDANILKEVQEKVSEFIGGDSKGEVIEKGIKSLKSLFK